MSSDRGLFDSFTPWTGLVVGLASLIVVHQFGSQGTFDDCRAIAPGPALLVAGIGFGVCLAAGVASWRSTRRLELGARRLIGIISVGSAMFFAFAILLAIVAGLILPPCFG